MNTDNFLTTLLLLLLLSCSNQEEKVISYSLYFIPDSSTVDKPFFRDSLIVMKYGKDSMLIKNYYGSQEKVFYYQNEYFNQNNFLFEKRYVVDLPKQINEIDTILTFSTKDSTFIYQTKRDDFLVTLIDLSLYNSMYAVEQIGNNYQLIKQSMVDSTYKEIFFYDKNYLIYKFINTFRDNKCVYISSN